MAYGRRWKPSRNAKREFAEKMEKIDEFCKENNIQASASMDSFYFTINGQDYRVSNHSVESSNFAAFDEFGNQVREIYHKGGRDENVIYIHASKTRIIEIYSDLKNGYKLNGKGNRI